MKNIRFFITVVTLGALVFTSTPVVHATNTQSYLNDLKEKVQISQEEKEALNEEIKIVSAEMLEAREMITEIYALIKEADIEISLAMIDKENQYDDMKTRIKYMYENSSEGSILNILFSATSLTGLLNRVEYANQVASYDRQKLEEFQKTILKIQDKEEELKEENERLRILQYELTKKKQEIEKLLKNVELTIEDLDEEIGAVADALIKAAEEEERKKIEADQGAVTAGSAGESLVVGNGTFAHPIPGYTYISSPYGYRYYPDPNVPTLHKGTDFAASTGTPVYAAMDGTVTISKYSSSAGNYISIDHGNGLVTLYMHNSVLYVSSGTKVSKGQNIALSGNTGSSSGPHLHFQVMLNGTAVNSTNYL